MSVEAISKVRAKSKRFLFPINYDLISSIWHDIRKYEFRQIVSKRNIRKYEFR